MFNLEEKRGREGDEHWTGSECDIFSAVVIESCWCNINLKHVGARACIGL